MHYFNNYDFYFSILVNKRRINILNFYDEVIKILTKLIIITNLNTHLIVEIRFNTFSLIK